MSKRKAIVLLSGGLDSATSLAAAVSEGFECYALSFYYGQKQKAELNAAKRIAEFFKVKDHHIFNLDLSYFGASALTDKSIDIPKGEAADGSDIIPVTYVPVRNLVFLSVASAWAESLDARDIFIGVNNVDYSGYPDCRPEFIEAFKKAVDLGSKAADDASNKFNIHAPLQKLSKAEIIKLGISLGVDYSLTVSCYDADENGAGCGDCASCRLRKAGFSEAGVKDPTLYRLT
jgi:7-cyano-7-deazaguanine synthase